MSETLPPLSQSLTALAAGLAAPAAADAPQGAAAVAADHRGVLACALAVVPSADWASVTRRGPDRPPRTIASSDPVASAADELQYVIGEGPCLEVAASGSVVAVTDLRRDDRWPTFARAAVAQTPVRAVLSRSLATNGHPGLSLNLYSSTPEAFDDHRGSDLEQFVAAIVSLGLVAVTETARSRNLERALLTSRQIGAAIGILMAGRHCTYDQGFDLMRTLSQRNHRRLSDIADEVVLTGDLPSPR